MFTMTNNGKCDVTVTLFTKENTFFIQRTFTFDVKPTIKELKERFAPLKKEGAHIMRITTTPSCNVKFLKL
jgi:hypothetical protein